MSALFVYLLGAVLSLQVSRTSHPVSMGGLLILVSVFNSIFLGVSFNSWMFYMLVLVFLGGVMVVLLFMVSICGNEKFFPTGSSVFVELGLAFLVSLCLGVSVGANKSFSGGLMTLSLYQAESAVVFVFFMLILVLCLVSVVKVSSLESGPLVKRLLGVSMIYYVLLTTKSCFLCF